MKQSREDFVATLRQAGLRATSARISVLVVLQSQPHVDAETLIQRVRQELGSISSQAIYNIANALAAAGLVRRIEPAGSSALYELRVGDNHHHVVCRVCGAIGDIDCALGERPCLTPSQTHGYLVDEAEVTYWGLCPSCQDLATNAERTSVPA